MNYFKPFRRKLGVVALLILLIFTTTWIRSHFVQDEFEYRFSRIESWVFTNTPRGIVFNHFKFDGVLGGDSGRGVTFIYAFILLPLMLLSAWLLLSKPSQQSEPGNRPA